MLHTALSAFLFHLGNVLCGMYGMVPLAVLNLSCLLHQKASPEGVWYFVMEIYHSATSVHFALAASQMIEEASAGMTSETSSLLQAARSFLTPGACHTRRTVWYTLAAAKKQRNTCMVA